MAIQSFSSFEAFFGANRHADLRAMLLGPGHKSWMLTHQIVNSLSVQWGQASGKAMVEGTSRPGGLTVFLQTQGTSSFSGNGRRLDDFSLLIAGPGDEFCLTADASPRRWCSLYIPNGHFSGTSGQPSPARAKRGVVQLPLERIEKFRLAVASLDQAVHQAPAAFDSAPAQKAAEQKLVREIRDVLAEPREVERQVGRHAVPEKQIIRSSMEFIEQHDGERLSVEQLAAAAGVSERTLRDAFQRYFGVAPVRYLNWKTLHEVRRALKSANPSRATVTEIATQFGIWQFGRFARDYRFLFHELPSETLRHQH
jgi:AraC-like DNA-binding protein